eukprot:m.86691 g.86691  ORF g.86691 m.86691 type:complete len:84 (-) comp14767_c0_seq79:3372-3623(-)
MVDKLVVRQLSSTIGDSIDGPPPPTTTRRNMLSLVSWEVFNCFSHSFRPCSSPSRPLQLPKPFPPTGEPARLPHLPPGSSTSC